MRKESQYKEDKQTRNAALIKDVEDLIADGYMKMQAYEIVRQKYGLYSIQGVCKILRDNKKLKKVEDFSDR